MRTHIFRYLLPLLFLGALCVGFQASSPILASSGPGDSLTYVSTSAPQSEKPSDSTAHHGDPYARIFLLLAILLLCAATGHFLARRFNQSAVLGELAVGILVGALAYQLSAPTVTILRDQVTAARLGLPEAQVVLGAAVLDDILSLIILAVVTGILTTGAVALSSIGLIVLKAVLFFAAVAWFGIKFLKKDIALFAWLDQSHAKLYFSFGLLLLLAWLADLMGLATIIGAFAAGLILEEQHFQIEGEAPKVEGSVESLLGPLEQLFAPVFFVLLGFQVDVTTFTDLKVLVLGLMLTLVAVFGKMAATLILNKAYHQLVVGFGLVPRGEVTLIFASLGKSMGVLSTSLYSVLIIVVLLTTLITPPCLTWAVGRSGETALT